MNTNWLREFVVLADTCSYAEAAARLFMGQSSLSKHIKALEEELGRTIHTSPLTQYNGALGAALFAYVRYKRAHKD